MHKTVQQIRRAKRTRSKVKGTTDMPRLSVYRSNIAIYAQLIDDSQAKTVIGISEKHLKDIKGNKTEKAKALGIELAKIAGEKKIKTVVFDKGSYKYHGRVKAVAEGAREGGLKF